MSDTAQLLQRVLDEQGHLIYGWDNIAEVGHIFSGVRILNGGKRFAAKAVVVGNATRKDFEAQAKRYGYTLRGTPWPYYYRVLAE